MSRLLLRRKLSIRPIIKPMPIIKEPIKKPAVEFRWSISAAQSSLPENNLLMNCPLVDPDSSQQKTFLSSAFSAARNSIASPLSCSTEKLSPCSPRLPNINNSDKKKELSTSTDENTRGTPDPLALTYSQLHHAQYPLQKKKNSRTEFSVINNDKSHSSKNQRRLPNDKYIRLPTSQLRRLHVSNKYMKEAKTLYFNPSSRVFVPRHSIIQLS